MSRSIRVAKEQIAKVKQALKRHGFPSQTAFAKEMPAAYATVSKFFNGKAVDYSYFVEFSEKLGLDWQAIAYIEPDSFPEPLIPITSDVVIPPPTPTPVPDLTKSIPTNLARLGISKEHFFGRAQALTDLHQLLQKNNQIAITAVSGMGGVGKTELAIQYAKQYTSDYPGGTCLFSAISFTLQLVEFARSKFFPNFDWEHLSLPERVTYAWQHWGEGKVLLIVDDVTDYLKQVKPFLPQQNRFQIIFTTRNTFQKPIVNFPLDVLLPDFALDSLTDLVGQERIQADLETAKAICQWLGYLPLGIELVGRYLSENSRLSLGEMMKRLNNKKLDQSAFNKIYPEMAYAGNKYVNLVAAFEVSWEELDTDAQSLGCYLSLYGLSNIPLDLASLPEDEQEARENALNQLIELHLLQEVETDNEIPEYLLHTLIRQFFQKKLANWEPADQLKQSFAEAMVRIAQTMDSNPTKQAIKEIEIYIPHLKEASNFTDTLSDDDFGWIFIGLGRFYEGQALYQDAQVYWERCVEIAENRLPADHPDLADHLNNLAELYRSQGRYSEAEPLYKRAIEIDQQSLPSDHPQLATHINNLAVLYESQGRYSEAEQLCLKAIEIVEKSLPSDHPQLATHINNLAGLYESQGRFSEAEPLYKRTIEIDEKSLPADHPSLATDLNNLAGLYYSQKRYSEGEPLYKRAIEIVEKSLPPDHPYLASSLNNLAGLYYSQGRYSEAEPLFLRAIEIVKKSLPPDHPDLARDLNNLAELYRSQGRYSEAEPLYLRAIEIATKSLGENHPNTQTIQQNYLIMMRRNNLGENVYNEDESTDNINGQN